MIDFLAFDVDKRVIGFVVTNSDEMTESPRSKEMRLKAANQHMAATKHHIKLVDAQD